MGHVSKDCPPKAESTKAPPTQVSVVNEAEEAEDQVCAISGDPEKEETIFRDVKYTIVHSRCNMQFKLNTLDTGSKISFIKKSFIPKEAIESLDRSELITA